MLKITNQRCMGMTDPIGIAPEQVQFSWIVQSDRNETKQRSYRLIIRNEAGLVWDSGATESDRCSGISCKGLKLEPETLYTWTVSVKDNRKNEAISQESRFETGPAENKNWPAEWISPKQKISEDAFCDWPAEELASHFGPVNFVGLDVGNTQGVAPAYFLRRVFSLADKPIKSARLYMTAGGIYEAYINGEKVSDTLFQPGFTPYDKYFEYQTFDITGLLERRNTIGVILADGWYKGRNGIGGLRELYGKQTKLLGWLKVLYADGTQETISTDALWKCAKGPYEYADLFVGEYYDARKALEGWTLAAFDDSSWDKVDVQPYKKIRLRGITIPPVRIMEYLKPKALIRNDIGETILDLGQNIAGFVRTELHNMEPGAEIIFEHTEMLDENGHYMNSINAACEEQIDHYICRGGDTESYCPRFTFHGFRYIRITGLPASAKADDFEGLAVATVLDKTMEFQCDNPKINQLQSNIYWSQMGNFLSIPTDCPQREKAGWTGDVFVYSNTASYVQDVKLFLKRWLEMAREEQFENGLIPVTVPYTKNYYYIQDFVFHAHTSCGWGDAIVEVPWVLYQQYGDENILRENFSAMLKWMAYVEHDAAEGKKDGYESMSREQQARQKYLWNTGFHYGDWSYPSCRNAKGETDNMQSSLNTREYVATAIYAHSCDVMSRVAEVLGETEKQLYYRKLNQKICQAFEEEYIGDDGHFPLRLQGLYVLSLAMDLVSGKKARLLAEHLNELIIQNDYCLDTGFMSVKFLLDVLCKYGYEKTAGKLLLQEKCPSWLYEVNNNATTVWSKWNAIQPETGRVTCASYNHYSFGAVGKWIYNRILGLDVIECGFRRFLIRPGFAYPFRWAKGVYRSVYGEIRIEWENLGEIRKIDLTVPVSTEAVVVLEDCDESSLKPEIAAKLQGKDLILGSGKYNLCYKINK